MRRRDVLEALQRGVVKALRMHELVISNRLQLTARLRPVSATTRQ